MAVDESLWQVGHATRLRNECLDDLSLFDKPHLRAVPAGVVPSCNTEGPQRSLVLDTPRRAMRTAPSPVHSRSVLGGLHHVSERAD